MRAVDDRRGTRAHDGAAVHDREDGRNLEGARDDRGVGGAAAHLGHDAGDVVLVDRRGHGRGEVVHHDDGRRRERGEVDDLLAQELAEEPRADVGDVGRAQAEHLVVHGEEHVLEHGARLDEGLLGADAVIDEAVDLVGETGILGHGDVADHDLGLVLAHGLLHVLGLGLGLLAEGAQGELVALALGGALILGDGDRLERKVGLDRHDHGTDADALGCVDSLEHCVSSLRASCAGQLGTQVPGKAPALT